MTAEETINNNELVALFMGAIFDPKWGMENYKRAMPTYVYAMDNRPTADSCRNWGAEQLQYNSSWDWLMPVVEKTEKSNFENYIFNYNITGDGVCISKYDDGSGIISNRNNEWGKNKLTATYQCVVEFIKWYNEQKTMSPKQELIDEFKRGCPSLNPYNFSIDIQEVYIYGKVIRIMKNEKHGSVSFSMVCYSKESSYNYVLTEMEYNEMKNACMGIKQ